MDCMELDVGVDVSKPLLDVAVVQTDEEFQVTNEEAGWAELIKRFKGRKVRVIGLEASGGYEPGIDQGLAQGRLSGDRVDAYRLRQYARAMGRLAKNDRIDARMIARFAAQMPTREPYVDPLVEQMAELVVARRQRTKDKGASAISSSRCATRCFVASPASGCNASRPRSC